ncbi:oxygenase MpaB family protein [Streptomyces sp. NPDC051985]|uniref:oxygenase MpaB family protein n=1 Tax=Streptomyces sp. NPDC051985 TaxID=3155807 RepID=UPI00341730FD
MHDTMTLSAALHRDDVRLPHPHPLGSESDMTAPPTPPADPEHLTGPDATHRGYGAQAKHVVALLTGGDPLADAVIAELDLHGGSARQTLSLGLRKGLASLNVRPPEAVAALLKQAENTPDRADPRVLHLGDLVSLSVPPLWFALCSVTSALTYSYTSPAVARALADAGQPKITPTQLLAKTAVWARKCMRPGGLLHGAPGYVATIELRLRQARMRATALADWDTGAPGLPIGHLDIARTWLGFTLTSFRALAAVGIELNGDEERRLYQYWAYVAQLLGIDERLHGDVIDHASAGRLRDLLCTVTAAPDENSRTLTAATVDAQSRAMAAVPGAILPEEQLRDLILHGLWGAFGKETAARLGISRVTATPLMPLIRVLNQQARHWQTFSPESAQAARRNTLKESERWPTMAVLPLSAKQHAAGGRSSAPAAWPSLNFPNVLHRMFAATEHVAGRPPQPNAPLGVLP